jgi:hypothetical protein
MVYRLHFVTHFYYCHVYIGLYSVKCISTDYKCISPTLGFSGSSLLFCWSSSIIFPFLYIVYFCLTSFSWARALLVHFIFIYDIVYDIYSIMDSICICIEYIYGTSFHPRPGRSPPAYSSLCCNIQSFY